ncbi:hypothetical protein VTJ04DRAFT_6783 [Mycothermus thermophilus]|uniref:uncharacterized protein n=1 Tax=Humicola insolens TaxID=85995 RepID=UPI00374464E7
MSAFSTNGVDSTVDVFRLFWRKEKGGGKNLWGGFLFCHGRHAYIPYIPFDIPLSLPCDIPRPLPTIAPLSSELFGTTSRPSIFSQPPPGFAFVGLATPGLVDLRLTAGGGGPFN